MGRNFAERSHETELMDTEPVNVEDYQACLKDLATVNALTLTHRPILKWLDHATRRLGPNERVTVLDVGYGYGDLLRKIHEWSRRKGRAVDLVGVDLNPNSADAARQATPADMPIEYRTGDYAEQPTPFDFVISSLVAHHMTDDQLRAFIRYMEDQALCGWLINDLHRHRLSYYGFPWLARLLGAHRIVREDGQLSIARSFRPAEWRAILADAGLPEGAARIVRRFPFRLCVERLR